MNPDIKTWSVAELKAFAFDSLVEIERLQKNLQVVTTEINKRKMEEIKPTPIEETKPTPVEPEVAEPQPEVVTPQEIKPETLEVPVE